MKRSFSLYFFLFFLIFSHFPRAYAQSLNLETDVSKAEYVTDEFGNIQTHIKPQDVIHWEFIDSGLNAEKLLIINIRLRTEKNFTIYRNKVEFKPPVGLTIKNIQYPSTTKILDPITKEEVEVFTGGEFIVEISGATNTQNNFELEIQYVGCTRVICLFPFTEKLIVVTSLAAEKIDIQKLADISNTATVSANMAQSVDGKLTNYFTELLTKESPIWLILLIAFIGGILTNFTPCVAPMIPITVRILSKQSKKPLFNASMYALGLMVTYTVLGLVAAYTASLFGSFIANPLVSLAFAFFMFVFGITMVGFGDLSKIQMFGAKIGNGEPNHFNTFLMGAAAGFVAAPCTGPILASILAYTASRQNLNEACALLLVYSFGFSVPYIFLGTFSQQISRIKISPFWQKTTKILFASVMFGLSFYYARVAFYSAFSSLKIYFPSIATFAFLAGLTACYPAFIRPHQRRYGLVASLFLGLSLFWVSQIFTSTSSELTWIRNEKDAIELARAQHKPLLLDSWAEWCEACKKMEKTTFSDPQVIKFLQEEWILAKIDLTEQNSFSEDFQRRYEIIGLPTLIALPESGENSKKILITGFVEAPELLIKLRAAKEKWQGKL